MSDFASPASATGIDWSTLNGALLIIDVSEVVKDINTVHGIRDAVRATISVVDGPLEGDTYEDTLVFPKVLKNQLATHTGKKVLGRLGQGVINKPGQKPPWKLEEATDGDRKTAADFLVAQAAGQLTADDI